MRTGGRHGETHWLEWFYRCRGSSTRCGRRRGPGGVVRSGAGRVGGWRTAVLCVPGDLRRRNAIHRVQTWLPGPADAAALSRLRHRERSLGVEAGASFRGVAGLVRRGVGSCLWPSL